MNSYEAKKVEKLAKEKWGSLAPQRCTVESVEVWKNGVHTGTEYEVTLNWVKFYDEDHDAILVDEDVEEFGRLLESMGYEVEFAYCPYGKNEFHYEGAFRRFCGWSEWSLRVWRFSSKIATIQQNRVYEVSGKPQSKLEKGDNMNMYLIMIDECGDEVEVDSFHIGNDLDEDYLDLWKSLKIQKARDEYPEARGFYFEDRRNWASLISQMMHF